MEKWQLQRRIPKLRTHTDQDGAIWALRKQPRQKPVDKNITDHNLYIVAQSSIVGIADIEELAIERAKERAKRPRKERQGVFCRHEFEPEYPVGALAILAYAVHKHARPAEFIIESYLGDVEKPTEVRRMPILSHRSGAIDITDLIRLTAEMETMHPTFPRPLTIIGEADREV